MSPCHGEDRQFKSDPGRHFCLGSSVGRAKDWKSLCQRFDSALRHHFFAAVAEWQTRYFEGVVIVDRVSSSLTSRTIHLHLPPVRIWVPPPSINEFVNHVWRHSQVVRRRSARSWPPSSNLGAASTLSNSHAGVAELADARDLKSLESRDSYRFDSGPRHQNRRKDHG